MAQDGSPTAGPALAVVVNASGGKARRAGAGLADELAKAFADAGAQVTPQLVDGEAFDAAVGQALPCDVIALGGGDGSIGGAAGEIAGTQSAMALLPLGTLNHLAHQLGVPPTLADAAKIAVSGETRTIDIGLAGEISFVNNASIGVYTQMVRTRDAHVLPKWLATVPAALGVLRRLRHRNILIEIEGKRHDLVTPLLFIGNNRYAIEGPGLGERERLDEGVLSLLAVRPRSALGLCLFALRALFGRADPQQDFAGIADVREFTVLGAGSIDVAHDGEVSRMSLPLVFRSCPGALLVKVPKGDIEPASGESG